MSETTRIPWGPSFAAATLALLYATSLLAQQEPAAPLADPTKQYGRPRVEFDVDGHQAFVVLPSNRAANGSTPWVWYAPTFHRRNPDERHAWMFTQLLAKGFAIAGVDVGESFGSPQGTKVFEKFHPLVVREYGLSPKACLLPISRGGLMLYNWAARNPDRVQCIGGIYPFVNLAGYTRDLERIAKAYSMSEEQLRVEISEHSPVDNLGPLAERKVPILHLHGAVDQVLPIDQNSGLLGERYAALGANAEIVTIYGKGHEVCPEFWRSRTLVDFFLSRGVNNPAP
jgi:pimeloyl-ACP methyl ester carboxylesterase